LMTEPTSPRLVLICGLPASGKTTLAHQLAARMPAVQLTKDDWVNDLGHDVWDDAFRVRLEARLWVLAQELLAHGNNVILEWGHWARAERDEKRLGARKLAAGVELHYLDLPFEDLMERVDRRQATGEWSASPITRAQMEEWAAVFEAPTDDEIQLFDEPLGDARPPVTFRDAD
jgi:predicted kinase